MSDAEVDQTEKKNFRQSTTLDTQGAAPRRKSQRMRRLTTARHILVVQNQCTQKPTPPFQSRLYNNAISPDSGRSAEQLERCCEANHSSIGPASSAGAARRKVLSALMS